MLFQEALELLKKGEKVARESWSLEEGYLVFLEGMKHVWKIITLPGPNAGNHIFSVDELCACDWLPLHEKQANLLEKSESSSSEASVEL